MYMPCILSGSSTQAAALRQLRLCCVFCCRIKIITCLRELTHQDKLFAWPATLAMTMERMLLGHVAVVLQFWKVIRAVMYGTRDSSRGGFKPERCFQLFSGPLLRHFAPLLCKLGFTN